MDENLVGYLIDALDPEDRQAVEAHLAVQPELHTRLERLRRALEPLADDAEAPAPPPDLALATLSRVAEHACRTLPDAPPPTPYQRVTPATRRLPRRADLLVAAAILIVISSLALTGVLRLRYAHDRT